MNPLNDSLNKALSSYELKGSLEVEEIKQGLIHQTFLVKHDGGRAVLQQIHPDFSEHIQENIERVTTFLAQRGVPTLRLIPNSRGSLTSALGSDGSWRLMTHIAGTSYQSCNSKSLAEEAGRLVARFHLSLNDFNDPLRPLGFPFHDWEAHRKDLIDVIKTHGGHVLFEEASNLAAHLLDESPEWEKLGSLRSRVSHGDLKFNNLLFRGTEAKPLGYSLIDLDTVGRRPLFVELGDAWRSWCSLGNDDSEEAHISLEHFAAALEGYFSVEGIDLEKNELISLSYGIERVSLELAIRFAADILRERYWDWDSERYARRGEHNLARAKAQWSLFKEARLNRSEMARILGV